MELFWLDQLLLLFWGLENWEWLHLSNFVFGAFGPLYYGEIIQYFICHHSEVPFLKATHVPESLFYYWDEGEKLYLLLITSVLSQFSLFPYVQKGFTNFKVDLSEHWFSDIFYQRIFFSPHGQISPQLNKN